MSRTHDDRLPPLHPEAWSDATRLTLTGTVAPVREPEGGDGKGGPLNILRTIAHHPHLLEPFLGFAATLSARGVLPRRDHEILALRAAWNCRSPFEWGHHAIYASAAGLDDAEIERVAAGADAPGWGDTERCLLAAADELHAHQDLSDPTWAALRGRYDEAQLLEVPFVVGQYTMLSMVANATGVALEDGLPPLPD
ncbi:MAG: carboxymuconolactone decarboxylase family protein [Deltaproteobacteria bacterium]|nr:carboxymuconolactone decarboxylase family protein [Deltaproteobacteria bacterium]MBW2447042.1 carboxymuconolactone decarboxylase family protein [Deltaproteobacteria bacterium]